MSPLSPPFDSARPPGDAVVVHMLGSSQTQKLIARSLAACTHEGVALPPLQGPIAEMVQIGRANVN